jgi:penicillin-binding protein 1A
MAVGRRKADARREPVFDAKPIPGLSLRLGPGDRSSAPEEKPVREPSRPAARRERRAAGDDEKRPRSGRAADKAEAKPSGKRSGRGGGGGKRRKWYVRLAYWGLVLALWGVIAVVGAVVWAGAHLPPIQSLEVPPRPPSIQILGLDGKTLATRGDMGGAAIAIKEMPPYLPRAFIAIEDRRF